MPVLGPRLAARLLNPVDGFSLVAERGRELVGITTVAAYEDDTSTGEVGLLVVDHCQRQGLGTTLLTTATREATRRSLSGLLLTVHPDNRAVVAMVSAAGLRAHVSTRDGFTHVTVPLTRFAPSPVTRAPGVATGPSRLHSTEQSANN
jgi:GNAT superfamily N-acetyltransferase